MTQVTSTTAEPDTWSTWSAPRSEEEFLARFGDTIDDRIAETLGDLLADHRRVARSDWRRPPWLFFTVILLTVLAWSVFLAYG